MTKIDMRGKKIGRLTVVKEANERSKEKRVCWTCQCKCGNIIDVDGKSLRNGNTKSCGCLQKDRASQSNRTHGLRQTRLYNIYADMKRRCEQQSRKAYPRYGGRGITVCEEWREDFQAFYDWAMANGYEVGLQIDRIDNDGNYEPENCRWVTARENNNNRRDNVKITINGEEHTIAEWERIYGLKKYRLNRAISRGVDVKRYLSQFERTAGNE